MLKFKHRIVPRITVMHDSIIRCIIWKIFISKIFYCEFDYVLIIFLKKMFLFLVVGIPLFIAGMASESKMYPAEKKTIRYAIFL